VTGWIVAYCREEDWTVEEVSALFSDEAMTGKGYGLRCCADSIWRGMGKEVVGDLVRVTFALRNGSARNIFS
jgi:hypothetical protein